MRDKKNKRDQDEQRGKKVKPEIEYPVRGSHVFVRTARSRSHEQSEEQQTQKTQEQTPHQAEATANEEPTLFIEDETQESPVLIEQTRQFTPISGKTLKIRQIN